MKLFVFFTSVILCVLVLGSKSNEISSVYDVVFGTWELDALAATVKGTIQGFLQFPWGLPRLDLHRLLTSLIISFV